MLARFTAGLAGVDRRLDDLDTTRDAGTAGAARWDEPTPHVEDRHPARPDHHQPPGRRPIYRVGYAPSPWEWMPWEYATDGRFAGRWDDPTECGAPCTAPTLPWPATSKSSRSPAPSPQLIAELDDIVVDEEDEQDYPTLPPGHVPRSWCEARILGHGT